MQYMIMDLSDGSIVADCFDSREEAQRSAINIFVAKDKWRMLNGFKPIEDNLIALPSVGDMFAYIIRQEACDKPPEEQEPENEDVKLEPVPIEDVTITLQKPHIPVVPLCATDEDIGHQGICHKCKFLDTDTMVCEMDNTLAIHHGIKYCANFWLNKSEEENPAPPDKHEYKVEDGHLKMSKVPDPNHRCEICKHYDLEYSYCRHESPPSVWSINKHNLCDKFEVKT